MQDRKTKDSVEREGSEEGGGGGEEEEEGEEYGVRRPTKKLDPKEPTREEREEHEKTHVPFRNWCRHCVRGRGKEEACREAKGQREVAEVHIDFMFMGDEGDGRTLAVLVAKERARGMTMATVAPRKSSGQWLGRRLMAFMKEAGCEVEPVVIRSDNEPALGKVVEEIGRLRAAKGGQGMVVENSPVRSSKSNGFIERTIQSVQGLVRTWRSSLEEKWGVKIDVEHRIWPWLVEMVGWLMSRAEVGADGKTGYERCKGRRARLPGMEFGEAVLWKRKREGGPLGKLACMWEDGIFLGVKGTTGEMIVGDKKGVWRTRTVRTKTVEERWNPKTLELIGGVPWRVDGGEGDGEDLKTEVTVMDEHYKERVREGATGEAIPRRMYIKKSDVEEHGYTARCPGCISILRGTARQEHTVECRTRIEKEMEGTRKARNAKARLREYETKKMEEGEQARKRRKERGEEEGGGDEKREEGNEEMRAGGEEIEKRKREDDERDDMEGGGGSSPSNKEIEKEMRKALRRMEREGRRKKRRSGEDDKDEAMGENIDEVMIAGYVVNEEASGGAEEEWDAADVDGDELDPEQVKAARKEELEFMIKKAVSRGGKEPTTTKWIDGWKADEKGGRFVRSRLVGRDFKVKGVEEREDLFAAMPPLETKKLLFRMVAAVRGQRKRRGEKEMKLMFIDVRKAHLNAKCEDEEWVALPEECWELGRYARLRRWLYGMRKAAAGWEEEYASKLIDEGFERGRGAPTVFHNKKSGVRLVVHGDDFTFAGVKKELQKMKVKMREWYDIKDRGTMGSDEDDIKTITILGRTLRWTPSGLEYEAGAEHMQKVLEAEGLDEGSKAAVSPAVRDDENKALLDEQELCKEAHRGFRSMGATLNYLGQDRSDVQYAVKEVCQGMSKPSEGGKARIKRIARYLLGAQRLVWCYGADNEDEVKLRIDVYVDSDWASGWSRKSTSGGMVVVNGAGIKHWSRTQKARALSSGEAEYYAMVTGCAEGLGMQSIATDLGWESEVRVWSDSSAARSVGNRRGLGKLRHVELKWLWVQDAVKDGRVKLRTVPGSENVADHLTKPKTKVEVEGLLAKVGAEFRDAKKKQVVEEEMESFVREVSALRWPRSRASAPGARASWARL